MRPVHVAVLKLDGYALPFDGSLRDFLYREDLGRSERAHFIAELRRHNGCAPHLGSVVMIINPPRGGQPT